MGTDSEKKLKEIHKQANSSRKEKIRCQLDHLIFLEQHGVIKCHESAQKARLEHELTEIEFSEKRSNSNHPSSI